MTIKDRIKELLIEHGWLEEREDDTYLIIPPEGTTIRIYFYHAFFAAILLGLVLSLLSQIL